MELFSLILALVGLLILTFSYYFTDSDRLKLGIFGLLIGNLCLISGTFILGLQKIEAENPLYILSTAFLFGAMLTYWVQHTRLIARNYNKPDAIKYSYMGAIIVFILIAVGAMIVASL